jgi:DNA invertase Pin-like site-specific DNA recombinase
MRAVVYARQSRTRDGSESIDIQLQACQDAAARFGWEVVATLVEPPPRRATNNEARAARSGRSC